MRAISVASLLVSVAFAATAFAAAAPSFKIVDRIKVPALRDSLERILFEKFHEHAH